MCIRDRFCGLLCWSFAGLYCWLLGWLLGREMCIVARDVYRYLTVKERLRPYTIRRSASRSSRSATLNFRRRGECTVPHSPDPLRSLINLALTVPLRPVRYPVLAYSFFDIDPIEFINYLTADGNRASRNEECRTQLGRRQGCLLYTSDAADE